MSTTTGQPWTAGTVAAIAAATFFIPLVGLVAGVIAMQDESKKPQGIGLLIWGGVMCFAWFRAFSG